MLGDVARALDDLRDRRCWGVVAKAVGLTLGLLVAGFWGLGWAIGIGGDMIVSLPWLGDVDLSAVGGVAYVALAIVGSAVLTPFVAALFVGFLLDDIVEAVERRRHPTLPPARPVAFARQMGAALKLFGAMIVANLLGLVVYFTLPPLAPAVFVLLNGYLIGREYFEMVAQRRLEPEAARALRRRRRVQTTALGALVALALSLPFANLIAPLVGVAAATHLYHRVAGRG